MLTGLMSPVTAAALVCAGCCRCCCSRAAALGLLRRSRALQHAVPAAG